MTTEFYAFIRRTLALTLLTYFVLPAVPGVTFTGNIWSALALVLLIIASAIGDLVFVSLGIWFFEFIGTSFSFDFQIKTRSGLAPIFLAALFLAELSSATRHSGLIHFDSELSLFASALAMALTTLATAWHFDPEIFNLNVDPKSQVTR